MERQSFRAEKVPGMILVDTSVWVDFFRGADSPERRALHRLIAEEEDLCLAGIILTELLQGIKNDRDFHKLKAYLLDFPCFGTKEVETYLHAGQIFRECRKKGKTVRKTVDCVIAAICIENNLILLHKDSDFERIQKCTSLKCYQVI